VVLTLTLVLLRRDIPDSDVWTGPNSTRYAAAYHTREITNWQKLVSHHYVAYATFVHVMLIGSKMAGDIQAYVHDEPESPGHALP
jgi:hypothetical protein